MNILVLSWRDTKHPLAGGAEQVMHEHMKGWIKAGHDVTFFSSHVDDLPDHEVIDGVHVIRRGYQYWGVQGAAFLWYLFSKHKNFDLVIDEFHGIPFFTPLYVGKPKLAVIQETAREVWLMNPLPFPVNLLIGLIGYIFEFVVFIPYKNVPFMTGSLSAKLEVSKMGIPLKNINIVNHGVLLTTPSRSVKKNNVPTILYLGRMSKDKGIEDALEVFSILDNKGKYNFWVFGKPETEAYGQKILKLVAEKKYRNPIRFWPHKGGKWIYMSDKKKFEVISQSTVMINPSAREGWGLVNIEANSMGVPVVAYKSSGLTDSVKDGQSGILCRESTPESMAGEVYSIVTNRKRYKKLVEGALRWSKNFSWENAVYRSLTLIGRVVKLNQ